MEMEEGPLAHVLASLASGFVGAVVATPADVVKSRVMNQPTDERGRQVSVHIKFNINSQFFQLFFKPEE